MLGPEGESFRIAETGFCPVDQIPLPLHNQQHQKTEEMHKYKKNKTAK